MWWSVAQICECNRHETKWLQDVNNQKTHFIHLKLHLKQLFMLIIVTLTFVLEVKHDWSMATKLVNAQALSNLLLS